MRKIDDEYCSIKANAPNPDGNIVSGVPLSNSERHENSTQNDNNQDNGNPHIISEDLFHLCKEELLYYLNEILPKVQNADYDDFLNFDQDEEAEDERKMVVEEGGDYPSDKERVDLYLYVISGLLWMSF